MRTLYKNPKELAICLKDLVDLYLEDLMEYEKLEEKVTRIVHANEDRFYKNGVIEIKISNVLGNLRMDIISKILLEN
ncbi:TIGR04540 family protein [Clostridium lundense]|uniref:TIGR04540 family protein n=1 Tax=Clostridium lundense TaxID=319475 RepID=UPI0004819E8E|nr:TIGR04540 family protein [Clostridium lundense]